MEYSQLITWAEAEVKRARRFIAENTNYNEWRMLHENGKNDLVERIVEEIL